MPAGRLGTIVVALRTCSVVASFSGSCAQQGTCLTPANFARHDISDGLRRAPRGGYDSGAPGRRCLVIWIASGHQKDQLVLRLGLLKAFQILGGIHKRIRKWKSPIGQ